MGGIFGGLGPENEAKPGSLECQAIALAISVVADFGGQ